MLKYCLKCWRLLSVRHKHFLQRNRSRTILHCKVHGINRREHIYYTNVNKNKWINKFMYVGVYKKNNWMFDERTRVRVWAVDKLVQRDCVINLYASIICSEELYIFTINSTEPFSIIFCTARLQNTSKTHTLKI